jgi:beta-glucanase (GH16 family)
MSPVAASAQVAGMAPAWSHLRHVRTIDFLTMPAWKTGAEPWPPVAQPYSSPDFAISASLFSGLRASYSPAANSTFSPAWASLSNELEAYPNADAMKNLGISPFSVSNGVLSITASPMSQAAKATLPSDMQRTYLSGALNTYPFSQTYGYFEILAKVPRGQGLWPAFWLLAVSDNWPPEIDAPEVLGDNVGTAYFSLHTTDKSWVASQPGSYNGSSTTDAATPGEDLSQGFHYYGVDWGPSQITFYIDRRAVATRPTPSDMHQPMYLIANLAVGGTGTWPGPPNASTTFPASLQIIDIEIWSEVTN